MERLYKIVLAAMLIVVLGAINAFAENEFLVEDGVIIKYNGDSEDVFVPAIIDGVEVTEIESYAFEGKNVVNVEIEDGIVVIHPYAFKDCKRLKKVVSPESMLLINQGAFDGCDSLSDLQMAASTTYLTYEPVMSIESLESTEIDGFLFNEGTITGYTGEDTVVNVPETLGGQPVKAISAEAFKNNVVITQVDIPDTVTSIGTGAFMGCTALEVVTLPKKLSSVGTDVFNGCISLKSITIPGTLKRVGKMMFYGCSALTDVVLEEGVQYTGTNAFEYCSLLTSVKVPSTLKAVSTWSFGYCKKLTKFDIPEGVTSLGSSAFYYCNVLNDIIIPDTVDDIGTHCFRECWNLSNLTLSNNVTTLQLRSFHNCGFEKIIIPNSVISIGKEVFYKCKKLREIEIPQSVTSIGYQAFYNCSGLKRAIIYDTTTTFVTSTTEKDAIVYGDIFAGTDATLYVTEDSAAHTYAQDSGNNYVALPKRLNVISTLIDGENSVEKQNLGKYGNIIKYTLINFGETSANTDIIVGRYGSKDNMVDSSLLTSVDVAGRSMMEKEISSINKNTDSEKFAKIFIFNGLEGLRPLYNAIKLTD